MTHSRRDFVKWAGAVTGALAGGSAIGASSRAAGASNGADKPALGLIFPPKGRGAPEEGLAMYANEIRFVTTGLGLKTMTPDGYDAVVDHIGPAAKELADKGAQAVVLMGTSLSFYKGAAFNNRLTETMKQASGLPCVTMSTGIIEGLRAVGATRVAAATAYNDEVNGRLKAFLEESGFAVARVQGLGIEKVEDVLKVTQPQLIDFGTRVFNAAEGADSILVSCGGLRTLEILAPLEEKCKVPAVSSTPHALWAGVRLLGLSGRAPGYGSLLEKG